MGFGRHLLTERRNAERTRNAGRTSRFCRPSAELRSLKMDVRADPTGNQEHLQNQVSMWGVEQTDPRFSRKLKGTS